MWLEALPYTIPSWPEETKGGHVLCIKLVSEIAQLLAACAQRSRYFTYKCSFSNFQHRHKQHWGFCNTATGQVLHLVLSLLSEQLNNVM